MKEWERSSKTFSNVPFILAETYLNEGEKVACRFEGKEYLFNVSGIEKVKITEEMRKKGTWYIYTAIQMGGR